MDFFLKNLSFFEGKKLLSRKMFLKNPRGWFRWFSLLIPNLQEIFHIPLKVWRNRLAEICQKEYLFDISSLYMCQLVITHYTCSLHTITGFRAGRQIFDFLTENVPNWPSTGAGTAVPWKISIFICTYISTYQHTKTETYPPPVSYKTIPPPTPPDSQAKSHNQNPSCKHHDHLLPKYLKVSIH